MENHSPLNCESAPLSAIVCACRAIAAAEKAAPEMAAMASYQRKEVLEHCVREFEERFEKLAVSLCIEAGKPIKVTTSASPSSHPPALYDLATPEQHELLAATNCSDPVEMAAGAAQMAEPGPLILQL